MFFQAVAAVPTLWDSIRAILPIVGWGTVITGCVIAFRWAWSLRGAIDGFLTSQTKAGDLAQKTYNSVERVKSEAIAQVKAATEAGEAKAAELREGINKLDTNHLSHIQMDIAEMNVKYDRVIGISTKQLEVIQAVKEGIAVLVALQQAKKD
jgi:predicted transcriptional regulator